MVEQTEITESRSREPKEPWGWAPQIYDYGLPGLIWRDLTFLLPSALCSSSLSFLLLLVRRVSPFLVTSNGRTYRRFGAGDAWRRDVSTMLNPDLGDHAWVRQLCGSPLSVLLYFVFYFLFFLFFSALSNSREVFLRKSQLLSETLAHFRCCDLHQNVINLCGITDDPRDD